MFVVVTSDYCWGAAPTEQEALINARKHGSKRGASRFVVELNDTVKPKDISVGPWGDIFWSSGDQDAVVKRWIVEGGKRRVLKEEAR